MISFSMRNQINMEFLTNLFSTEEDVSGEPTPEQNANEAIVDLLLVAVYADNHLSLAEGDVLGSALEKTTWKGLKPLDLYVAEFYS